MLIRCPECQFERDLNIAAIPPSATKATCPKCGHKFRFREPGSAMPEAADAASAEAGEERKPLGTPAVSQEGDDPLPPGAVIPHMESDGPEAQAQRPGQRPEPARELHDDSRTEAKGARGAKKDNTPTQMLEIFRRPDMDETSALEVPWERIDLYGYVGGFYHTVLRVLFKAPEFFTNIRSANTPVRALIFYVIMGIYQILTLNFWYEPFPQMDMAAPQAEAMVNGAMGPQSLPMLLLLSPFALLLQALVWAGLYHLMFRLAQPDKADFAATLRVICYSSAPYIVCLVPMLGHLVALPWFVACTFVGCKYALGLSWSRTTLALAPLFILGIAMLQFTISVLTQGMGG